MDLDALAAVGLYDPDSPDAPARRVLLEYLLRCGFTVERIIEAAEVTELEQLVTVLVLRPGPYLTAADVAQETGITPELVDRVELALGFRRSEAERPFTQDDLAAFNVFKVGSELFGDEATLHFSRVIGSSMARVAEAGIALFLTRLEGPLTEQHADREVIVKATVEAVRALTTVPGVFDPVFRRHAQNAIDRFARAREDVAGFDSARLAVGFVDLVGYTPLSSQVPARRLAELLDEFEALASDVVADRGGRVVKHIGDAVMFVAEEARAACDVALTLSEHFAGDEATVTPRGAVAVGDLVVRAGDYYGPVVNLAARAADLAVPYEVLATTDVADACAGELVFEPAGRRMLKGFAEPVPLMSVTRRPPTP